MTDNGNTPANARISKSWFDKIPNEIMLHISSFLVEGTDIINLAVAQPDRFLSPTLNVFLLDAERQVGLQAGRSSPELTEDPKDIPLLNIAIQNGFDVGVIRSIVEAYQATHPDSINGIWGQVPRAVAPPLHCAVEAGRAEVISLLLDLGADPQIKFIKVPRTDEQEKCDYEGLAHQECMNGGAVVSSMSTTCDNPLEAAILAGDPPNSNAQNVQAIHDCAMKLFRRVPTLQSSLNTRWLISAARSGMERLIKERLNVLAARDDNDEEKQDFRSTCGTFLGKVSMQGDDNLGELIEYLGGLGGPDRYLIQPVCDQDSYLAGSFYHNDLMRSVVHKGKPNNAASLLKVLLQRGVKIYARDLLDYPTDDRDLAFTKVFIQALKDGKFFKHREDVVPYYMDHLLDHFIARRSIETCKWLISQDCPVKAERITQAADSDEKNAGKSDQFSLEALMRSGIQIDRLSWSDIEDEDEDEDEDDAL
ncbi:hypothetical protein F4775DRAFT_477738 [Biscogniauxia sp. FL1348]|nr:hypothetical protein F4775DRAFT_477738 [Biscogniauxia sp. FL1348]